MWLCLLCHVPWGLIPPRASPASWAPACLPAHLLQMGSTVGRTLAKADVFIYWRQNAVLLQMAVPQSKQCTLTLSHYSDLCSENSFFKHSTSCLRVHLEFGYTNLAIRTFCPIFVPLFNWCDTRINTSSVHLFKLHVGFLEAPKWIMWMMKMFWVLLYAV